jgi:hypothetical protein
MEPFIGTSFPTQLASRALDEPVLMVRKDSGDAHLDYLKVTLAN